MPLQPKLKPLAGASRLGLAFFNSLINRIETVKPVAGFGVSITEGSDGSRINVTLFGGNGDGAINVVTLNVCSNGEPDTLLVLSPS